MPCGASIEIQPDRLPRQVRRDLAAVCAAPVPLDGVRVDERANRCPVAVHD